MEIHPSIACLTPIFYRKMLFSIYQTSQRWEACQTRGKITKKFPLSCLPHISIYYKSDRNVEDRLQKWRNTYLAREKTHYKKYSVVYYKSITCKYFAKKDVYLMTLFNDWGNINMSSVELFVTSLQLYWKYYFSCYSSNLKL